MSLKRWVSLLSIGAAIFVAAQVMRSRYRATAIGRSSRIDKYRGRRRGNRQVIVTAQRRSERQEDVPMTVSVLFWRCAPGHGCVSSTTELYRVTPGIQLPMFGAYVSPSIRGVSSNTTAVGLSSNVALSRRSLSAKPDGPNNGPSRHREHRSLKGRRARSMAKMPRACNRHYHDRSEIQASGEGKRVVWQL